MNLHKVTKIDLRTRCNRCNCLIKSKRAKAEFERYQPYCSYHCQEWAQLENAQRYINSLKVSDS